MNVLLLLAYFGMGSLAASAGKLSAYTLGFKPSLFHLREATDRCYGLSF